MSVDIRNPLIIDQFNCLAKECTNGTTSVCISDNHQESIKETYNIQSPQMHFAPSDNVLCANITLSSFELLPAQGYIVWKPFYSYAYEELQTLTIPPVSCLTEGTPRSLLDNNMDHC
ncbi:hypothetical protein SLA2020_123570 [Shorea laevis]